MFDAIAALKIM